MNISKAWLYKSIDSLFAISISTALIIIIIKFNIFATIDGDIHLNWIYHWNQQISNGQLYPKWFEEAFNGLGTTAFIFYPPLIRLFSIPFGVFNLPPTIQIKGTIIIFLLINSYGVLKLSNILFQRKSLYSLIAIALGIFNPFLLSEILKRGGFPSLCFISLVPWLMIAIISYSNNPKFSNFAFVSFICAAIFLTHVPSCLIFASTYTISLAILFIFSQKKFRNIIICLFLAFSIGLAIDAFFILPILFDTHLAHQAFIPNINVIKNRLFFYDIYSLKLNLYPPNFEAVIANIFFFNIFLFILTIFVLFLNKRNEDSNFIIRLQALIVFFSLLMNTGIAYPIYQNIESFRKLQFPWRYLCLSSALIPYLATYTFISIKNKYALLRKYKVAFFIILIVVLLNYKSTGFILRTSGEESSFINQTIVYDEQKKEQQLPNNVSLEKLNEQYYYLSLPKKGAPIFFLDNFLNFISGDVIDYVPKTVKIDREWLALKREKIDKVIRLPLTYSEIEFIKGEGQYNIKKWGTGKRIFDLQLVQEAVLNLRTFYYPGWKIKINPGFDGDKSIMTFAKDGRIQLKLPKGNYNIEIYYKGTKAEQIGLIISAVTVFIIGILFIFIVTSINYRRIER